MLRFFYTMKLDILALAAHPDDTELGCAGTLYTHILKGKKVGVVDFTQGELGTRGTVAIRTKEANDASKILGLSVRENLKFRDGFFRNDEAHQLALVQKIRTYQPDIVLANALDDRHPDHGKAAQLSIDALFLSGLRMVETTSDEGVQQAPWRPRLVLHYIQSKMLVPDLIVDVSAGWDKKIEAIKAFESQFFNTNKNEPATYISNPEFLKMIEARGKEFGHSIGAAYGEGFQSTRNVGVENLFELL